MIQYQRFLRNGGEVSEATEEAAPVEGEGSEE
jgi:hypothetical protein